MVKRVEITFNEVDDQLADRTSELLAEEQKCHDCGAQEGEFHRIFPQGWRAGRKQDKPKRTGTRATVFGIKGIK